MGNNSKFINKETGTVDIDAISKERNEQIKKALKATTNQEIADSVSRTYAIEFDQENPIELKEKPKKPRKTIIPGKGGKGNYAMGGIVKMSNGGPVPSKYKGFSKLPEPVQEKIDPSLATKYNAGGMVKKNKSKNNYRGQYDIQKQKVKFKGVY
tara:strand:+ start:5093 stop:5554 length:462 start_codon:yes stop_codon:yes gene_type:complete